MAVTKQDDIVHEYLEARLNEPFGRRGFLKLSSGVIVTTAMTGALGAFLAACSSSNAPAASKNIDGAALEFIGLDLEDAAKVEPAKAWRDQHKVTLNSKYIGTGDEIFAALTAGQQFDISIAFNPYVLRYAEAKLIKQFDSSRLKSWADMYPGLRDSAFLNKDGKPYGAPIAWGDGPFMYNPKKVTKENLPTGINDLFDAKWKKRLTMSNDPAWLFHLIAVAEGMKSPDLTKAELDKVVARATPFVKEQVVTFAATYADCTDLLVRGEVDGSLYGWEAMLNMAKDKGGEIGFSFLKEAKGGWSDSMCIPTSVVDEDAAYAYIDQVISPEINAQLAVSMVSGAVNKKAVPLIPAKDNIYDYKLIETPQAGVFDNYLAPETVTDPNLATRADWTAAWSKITA